MNDYSPEKAIICLKPDAAWKEIDETLIDDTDNLRRLVIDVLNAHGLTIEDEDFVLLDNRQARNLYHQVLETPSEYGNDWKEELIDHMTENATDCFLVSGENAQDACEAIKAGIRALFLDADPAKYRFVKNLVHVPDRSEVGVNKRILFPNHE